MKLFLVIILTLSSNLIYAQNSAKPKETLPVRGFCIAAPNHDDFNDFLKFVVKDLAVNNVNTLILRIDFNYEYESYPNLRSRNPITKDQAKKLVKKAKKHHIRIIPQINLLGHQSWETSLGKLLTEYPEFDETPNVKIPSSYSWPNADGLYCKSYCPGHPDVHKVVFALVDEIMDVFEADAFHAGMDEVFFIGHKDCPRCRNKDRSVLFADEVTLIRNHLAEENRELWIWGDRLIDGKTTGLGEWEASMNDTHRAIDMIPKDVVICDWHYQRAEPTAVYFAMKGFRVVSCPWNTPKVAERQYDLLISLRENSSPQLSDKFIGMVQTIWFNPKQIIEQSKNNIEGTGEEYREINTYRALYRKINGQ
ncbi:MAG: family 20 glycosylhydrolase [Bacteroidales bacterium]|nr:family 20 glycosylhydrolase [Bacteroidales bacterium]MCF8390763.1 family 20 glycosylhydrolase [Bacteroidales bacterium]